MGGMDATDSHGRLVQNREIIFAEQSFEQFRLGEIAGGDVHRTSGKMGGDEPLGPTAENVVGLLGREVSFLGLACLNNLPDIGWIAMTAVHPF